MVLGANRELIMPTIDPTGIIVLKNADWADGMASSIRIAVTTLKNDNTVDSALFTLCDQPFVNIGLIKGMVAKRLETGKDIIACTYNNITGVPMLFSRSLFESLISLQGHEGAKKLASNFPNRVALVPFEQGRIDIDTLEDYERLVKNHSF